MSSFFGNYLHLSLFGQSHGAAIGITVDGFPAGMTIDEENLLFEMGRRAPGKNAMSTQRKEADLPEILSGVMNGKTTGQPLCAVIRNSNQHSSDYGEEIDLLRPGHADYTGHVRYFGFEDFRGGGHFSGRLTAPIVFAGALCSQYLREKGIRIASHVLQIEDVRDLSFADADPDADLSPLRSMDLPTIDLKAAYQMKQRIQAAREAGDSVGGIIECRIDGMEPGLGAPFFDSVESVLSHLMFSIPAVKGIEFGDGFGFASIRGSAANDAFRTDGEKITTATNHTGGINGGITNGMPVVFRIVFRPTPSIAMEQQTVSLKNMENAPISVKGRHDPCIVPRAVPVVDAMAAIGIMEMEKERAACLV